MAIARDSADQKKYSAERGVKPSRVTSGMNKLPPGDMTGDKSDDRSKADTRKKSEVSKDADIISKAKKCLRTAITTESSNRKDGLDDLKFINGEQWDKGDEASRVADGRPCITENRLPTFANQITNDQRQNRPAIVVSPMGDQSSKKSAKILRGMIRAIERDSSADVAYDTAFQSAVHNGWGYCRIMSEYEDDKSHDQVLVIRPLANPFNVYMDPHRTPFMLDARWCFITEMVPREEFRRDYPDAMEVPWDETGTGDSNNDWATPEDVRVVEYYYFDHEDRELVLLENGHSGWEDELDPAIADQVSRGTIDVMSRRTVQVQKLKWCKLTAVEILERSDCDGQYIPVVECYGTVLNINGKTIKKGIVRDAKGPARINNYYVTLEAENVALQPKAPWIMEEGQIEGHEAEWRQANKKSYSYLTYKGVALGGKPAPPPQRQPFQGPPAAILAAKQGAVEALKAVTGIRFDATMSERMKDESGRAIRELNQNANLGAYHYIDNFGRFLKNVGTVLCDLIPYVYDRRRIVAILDETGAEDRVTINPHMSQSYGESVGRSPEDNQTASGKIKHFNPKVGRYQVTVTIGPSYATKRIEANESQMDFLRAVPQIAPIVADLVAKNSDWEGAEEFASRIAKSLPPNLLAPSKDDMNPQVQALIQGLQQQLQQQAQQMQMMQKELTDRQKDRDVIASQIAAKHDADMTKIAAHFTEEMEKLSQKRDATMQGTIGRQLAEVAKAVQSFQQMIPAMQAASPAQPLPAQAAPGHPSAQSAVPAATFTG